MYLILLDLKREELENFEKEDEIVQEFKSKIFELNDYERFLSDITKEEILVQNTQNNLLIEKEEASGKKKKQLENSKRNGKRKI